MQHGTNEFTSLSSIGSHSCSLHQHSNYECENLTPILNSEHNSEYNSELTPFIQNINTELANTLKQLFCRKTEICVACEFFHC